MLKAGRLVFFGSSGPASLRLDCVARGSSALGVGPLLGRLLDVAGLVRVLAVRLIPVLRIDVLVAPGSASEVVLLVLVVRLGAICSDFGRSETVFDLATFCRGADMVLVDCVRE